MKGNKELFEQMPVAKALATLAVPTIISQLITIIYNLADTFFVGRTNDPFKVAAATISFLFLFMTTALANLFGIGGGSLISRLLGEKKPEEAKRVCALSFYGAVLISAIYVFVMSVYMEPILRLAGASDNTIVYAKDYIFWAIIIGGIPTTVSLTVAHLLRSEGFARDASIGLGMGGISNIILDPIFMFYILPKGQEVAGAAIATMVSNMISCIYLLIVFLKRTKTTCMSVSIKNAVAGLKYTLKIFSVGFPSTISTLLSCISNSVINNLISGYGDIPMAAMGIVKKIDMIPLSISMGICQGMLPLVAYNYASGNYKRMRAFSNCAILWGILFAGFCILIFELFTGHIVRLFIEEEETLALGTSFLSIACLATPLMITNVQMNYTFQAMGKGPQTLLLASCRQGLINIPLLFIMNSIFGLYGIICTQIIADGITMIISFSMYLSIYKQLKAKQNDS